MAKVSETTAPTPAIAPRAALRLLGWMCAGALLLLGVVLGLPVEPYYRFQQTDGTILFRARWIYERIHFDPAPIDVALIGSSRMEASVRSEELARLLSVRTGRDVHVVNFGLPQEGRDLHWIVASELLRQRPEVRLVLLSVGAETQITHPGFRLLADDRSVATAPIVYNTHYLPNLLTVPYQHIAYFTQGMWPGAFGLSTRFDAAIYRARSFDPTVSFHTPTTFVDRDRSLDPVQAESQRGAVAAMRGGGGVSSRFPLDQRFPIEREYVRRIAALARQHGAVTAFLRVPVYREDERVVDRAFYAAIGPVFEATQFGADPADYMDIGHLGRHGTARLVPWLADRLAPLIATPEILADVRPLHAAPRRRDLAVLRRR